jgi:hypothetical protein
LQHDLGFWEFTTDPSGFTVSANALTYKKDKLRMKTVPSFGIGTALYNIYR